MTRHRIIGSRARDWLFGGVLLALIGIGLICVSAIGGTYVLNALDAALVLAGALMWFYGAVRYQGELLDGRH